MDRDRDSLNRRENGLESVRRLEAENAQLREQARRDWLTRLYNRGATEELVNQSIGEGGGMIVMDIDRFKQVNDRWGHLTGDRVLRQIGGVIRHMFFASDIVGRIGGDEFLAFIRGECTQALLQARVDQLKQRLADERWEANESISVRISAGWALARPGDDYEKLFARADEMLLCSKRNPSAAQSESRFRRSIEADMRNIRSELREEGDATGAFCRSYEHFESIYRYVERTLKRTNESACVILFTLTDRGGNLPDYPRREAWMAALSEAIRDSLRASDVYTQYSSGQFLVMGTGAELQYAERIAERVREGFYSRVRDPGESLLLHASFPMQPK